MIWSSTQLSLHQHFYAITCTRLIRKLKKDRTATVSILTFYSFILHLTNSWLNYVQLRHFELTSRPTKIVIEYTELSFLKYIVGKSNLKPKSSLTDKILFLPIPRTKQVLSLPGLVNFFPIYSQFLRIYVGTLWSHKEIRTKQRSLETRTQALQSIEHLILTNCNPILRLFDLSLPFHLVSDASNTSTASCIMQKHNVNLHLVGYASRKQQEMPYPEGHHEAMINTWSIRCFAKYLASFVKLHCHENNTYLGPLNYQTMYTIF